MEAQHQHAQVETAAGKVFQDVTAQDEGSSREQSHGTNAQGPMTSTEAKDELVRVVLFFSTILTVSPATLIFAPYITLNPGCCTTSNATTGAARCN